jgi:hypothetical protein
VHACERRPYDAVVAKIEVAFTEWGGGTDTGSCFDASVAAFCFPHYQSGWMVLGESSASGECSSGRLGKLRY